MEISMQPSEGFPCLSREDLRNGSQEDLLPFLSPFFNTATICS